MSYRIEHDVAAAFPRIQIPLAIFFGDEDPFASVRTTRNVYRAASSEYLLWRPVRGNSHLDSHPDLRRAGLRPNLLLELGPEAGVLRLWLDGEVRAARIMARRIGMSCSVSPSQKTRFKS